MPRGGFGRGFGGFGRGFGMRRMGAPIIAPMGGMGWGMGGMGSPLINTLMAGGLGYMLGSNSAQQQVQQPMVAAVPTVSLSGTTTTPTSTSIWHAKRLSGATAVARSTARLGGAYRR